MHDFESEEMLLFPVVVLRSCLHMPSMHLNLNRDSQRFTFLLLGSKNKVGIYQVLVLPINSYILKFHRVC